MRKKTKKDVETDCGKPTVTNAVWRSRQSIQGDAVGCKVGIRRINKLTCVFLALLLFSCALTSYNLIQYSQFNVPAKNCRIAIDAGHGGVDGGVKSADGVCESDLNLEYAKALEKRLSLALVETVMTRKDGGGLYGLATKGFKRRDMEKRREIIVGASPDLVISIHMNKYSDKSRRGPQVFFQEGDSVSQALAIQIQNSLNSMTGYGHSALDGDFYICRCAQGIPSVIVECGFLSNAEEACLLGEESYRNELIEAIFIGIMRYLYSG